MEVDFEELSEQLAEQVKPTDGVVVLILRTNQLATIIIPQMGLMSEAHVERSLNQIYLAISQRRAELARLETSNAPD